MSSLRQGDQRDIEALEQFGLIDTEGEGILVQRHIDRLAIEGGGEAEEVFRVLGGNRDHEIAAAGDIGQREGDIEVLEIDQVAGMVKVRNAGVVEELTFDKNGPKLPSTPAPGAPAVPRD